MGCVVQDDKSRLSRTLREVETARDMLTEHMASLEDQLVHARQAAANYSLNSAAEVEMLREQLAVVQVGRGEDGKEYIAGKTRGAGKGGEG